MKKIYFPLLISFFIISNSVSSQQVQWLNSTAVNYNLNPEMPLQPATVSGADIYSARLVDFALNFGQDILGSMSIDHHDTSGTLLWSFSLGAKLTVTCIHADDNGHIVVGGTFMETLQLNGTDSLENTGTGLNTNLFLLCLNSSGALIWKRNVSIGATDAMMISSLDADAQNQCWYGIVYFDSSSVIRLDASGNDVQSYSIQGTRLMSSFSFDPNDNLYIAGSAGFATLNVNGMSVNLNEPYMMFVTRINSAGVTSWIELAHDQTFQDPHIVATASGDAYVGASLLDSTTFGNVIFEGPQWVYDIFVTRVDSIGNFFWGIEVPETPNIVGDFQRGKKNFFDVDDDGNLYLIGKVRGSVDWGNGVVTTAGLVQNYGVSVISYDPNGVARWQVTGTAAGFATPYSICAGAPDECYFACSVEDTATFGSFTVNQNGGYAYLLGKINSAGSLGINDPLLSNSFYIFPNPVHDNIVIQLPENIFSDNLDIYNVLGEKVLSKPGAAGNPSNIDVSSFSPGVYIIKWREFAVKFVKE